MHIAATPRIRAVCKLHLAHIIINGRQRALASTGRVGVVAVLILRTSFLGGGAACSSHHRSRMEGAMVRVQHGGEARAECGARISRSAAGFQRTPATTAACTDVRSLCR